jgi:peptide chain release factor 1
MRSDSDYRFEIFKSQGAGGQSRNKTSSGVKCIHVPTGIKQERTTKCQHSNRKTSLAAVNKILDDMISDNIADTINTQRSSNMGTGKRGSKIRIYKFQKGLVNNVKNGKQLTIKQFFKGSIDKLWN